MALCPSMSSLSARACASALDWPEDSTAAATACNSSRVRLASSASYTQTNKHKQHNKQESH